LKKIPLIAAAIAGALLATAAVAGAHPAASKAVDITVWHAQADSAQRTFHALVTKFNTTHPGIVVHDELGSTGDEMVQKLQAVIGSDNYPDIAYVYGSDVPNVSQSSKVVDISKDIKATGFDWNSLYPAGRSTATVGSKVVGFPAVIDNLAVVYNKKLLKAAGVAPPKASWTWADYRAMAKKLTNANKGVFGTGYPISGSEDTVWRLWPMIWQQGGEVLNSDNTKALFAGAQGQKALQLLTDMAIKDKSLYADQSADTEKMYGLFDSGKMGMIVTGPWQLSDITDHKVSYGVQLLPSFGTSHETISGPDVYMVFNHSDDRRRAAATFLSWLHQPAQDLQWDIGSGNLPLSAKTAALPAFKKYAAKYPGVDLFVKNLANARHIRPPVPQYTAISTAVGKAIATSLLGRGSPKDTLGQAAQAADKALS
jgi:ABC-type glycerol-3-phosphate transport system substrate-binding protein